MRVLIGALLVALTATPVAAQDRWLLLHIDGNAMISLDTTRIASDSGRFLVWTQWRWNAPQQFKVSGKDALYSTAIEKWEIDCRASRLRPMSSVYYKKSGEVLYSHSAQPYEAQWEDPIPDSYGESALRGACRVASGEYGRELAQWQSERDRQTAVRADFCSTTTDAKAKRACAVIRNADAPSSAIMPALRTLNAIIGLQPLPAYPVP